MVLGGYLVPAGTVLVTPDVDALMIIIYIEWWRPTQLLFVIFIKDLGIFG